MSHSVSTPNSARMIRGRTNWVPLLGIVALAAVLQLVIATRSGLWGDEIFSLAMATGHSLEHPAAKADPGRGDFVEPHDPVPAEEFRRYLMHDDSPANPARVIRAVFLSDTNPPLYYLLLYWWTLGFGTSDIAVRLFSITCALICLPFLADIARRTGAEVFSSCLLFVLSPLGIYYSTEGRMYSLLWLCVLATAWSSLVLQQNDRRIVIYALWIVASVAGFLTHYFFVFPWLAIVAYLAITPGKLGRLNLVVCLLVSVALILPWYVKIPETLAAWRVTKDWLKWKPEKFNRGLATLQIFLQPFSGGDNKAPSIAAAILFGLIGTVMFSRMRLQAFAKGRLLLWLAFVAASLGLLAFDLAQHTYTLAVPRYAIAALPFAYLLASVGLTCLGRFARFVVLIFIIFGWSLTTLGIYASGWRGWSPLREIANIACAHTVTSDLILVRSIPSTVLGIARYARTPAALASWIAPLGMRQVPESLRELARGRTQIILIQMRERREPVPEQDWLRGHTLVTDQRKLGSAEIVKFRPLKGDTF